MKFRMLASTATWMVLWVTAATVYASEPTSGNDSARPTPPATAATAKPAAVLPELKFEFQAVVDGTEVTHDFTIKNTGDDILAINQVKTG